MPTRSAWADVEVDPSEPERCHASDRTYVGADVPTPLEASKPDEGHEEAAPNIAALTRLFELQGDLLASYKKDLCRDDLSEDDREWFKDRVARHAASRDKLRMETEASHKPRSA